MKRICSTVFDVYIELDLSADGVPRCRMPLELSPEHKRRLLLFLQQLRQEEEGSDEN